MRAKYYYRLFGQMHVRKAFAFILIFIIIFILFYFYFVNQVSPTIKTLSETRAKAIALKATNEAVMERIEKIKYDNLIHITTDSNGNVKAVNADVIEMNKLATEITTNIQQKLIEMEDTDIQIPLGRFLGLSVFSGYGPKITVRAIPTGNVSVDFKTEFKSEGINQTRHRIYLQIKTSVRTVAPFISGVVPFETDMTVAETVIVGDIPTSYYNLEGVESLDKLDTTEFME